VKRNELTIIGVVAVIGLVIAFWLLAIGPKRKEAADLQSQITDAHAALDQAQQATAAGEQARKTFPIDYRRLVVLGKAAPQDGEQASLLVQLQSLAERSGIRFQSIDLSDASTTSSAATPTAPATDTSTSSTSDTSTSSDSSSTSTTSSTDSASTTDTTAAATEASAAALPIGATVGAAGLPVMPYDLKFTGDYFQIADFLKRLDGMVNSQHGLVDVHGRLLTVDALSLAPVDSAAAQPTPLPPLVAQLTVNAYISPADQGITAGATPAGPAPATSAPDSTTTAGSTSASTPTPTATSSP